IVQFYCRQVRDSNKRSYAKITLARRFEVSTNTVDTQAVQQAYKDNSIEFTDKMKEFGFNGTLGIDLKGEPASYIPVVGDKNLSKIALPWMAYGYGILDRKSVV